MMFTPPLICEMAKVTDSPHRTKHYCGQDRGHMGDLHTCAHCNFDWTEKDERDETEAVTA